MGLESKESSIEIREGDAGDDAAETAAAARDVGGRGGGEGLAPCFACESHGLDVLT